jgi:hypothetical protein
VVEFQIAQTGDDGNVFPMVPAGAALHEMIERGSSGGRDKE